MVLSVFPEATTVYGASQECGFLTNPMDRPAAERKLAALGGTAAYRVLES